MKKYFILIAFFLVSFNSVVGNTVVKSLWGDEEIVEDPLIEKVLMSKTIQRLKGIDQSGPDVYLGSFPKFSRFEHSVGVWMLLKKIGAPLKEQIAGLLHDASHLAFSHVADVLYQMENQEHSYQDQIHLEYLSKTEIPEILREFCVLKDLDPDLPEYKGLEQSLPDMCADRVQYNIHTGVITERITKEQAKAIVEDLKFENGKWYFENADTARLFASLSLYFTKNLWGSARNHAIYHYFSSALKQALDIGLIDEERLQFGQDQEIMEILENSRDNIIVEIMSKCKNIEKYFGVMDSGYSTYITPKFRGINPLVKVQGNLVRLTDISEVFKSEYFAIKDWCTKGYGIKFD